MKRHKNVLIAAFVLSALMIMPAVSAFERDTESRLWKWAQDHYYEMLNHWFPMKYSSNEGYDTISFRYYSSLFGLNVKEYSFYLYASKGDACKAVFRHTKGPGLCAQIAQQIEFIKAGKTNTMISHIEIEEHSVTSQECPKIKEYYEALKKVKVPLYEKEMWLDPPQYEFYYEHTNRHYISNSENDEISRIAIEAYKAMVECHSAKQN